MFLGSRLSGHSAGPLEWKLTAVEVWKTVHPISLYGGERTFRSGRRNGDGDSVDVLVQEIFEEGYPKIIKVDNTAAINLLTEASGSWRTRHLRLKASHVRWRFGRMDWMVEAVPGQHQIADVGTKSLPAPRLEELKKMMKMGSYERTKEESEEKEEDISQDVQERDIKEGPKREDVEKILRVIVALDVRIMHMHKNKKNNEKETADGRF